MLIQLGVAVALFAAAYAYGYHKGTVNVIEKVAEATAEKQEEIFDLADKIRSQSEALRQAQKDREELINELEEQANNAVGAGNDGVATTGGLQRLERRWAPAPGTSE
jgi:DNA anti-recombination protein RmuC